MHKDAPTTLRLRSRTSLGGSGTRIAAAAEATGHTSPIESKVNSLKDGCGATQRLNNTTGRAATKGRLTLRKHNGLSLPGKNRRQTRDARSGRAQMFMSQQQMPLPKIPYCVIDVCQYIVEFRKCQDIVDYPDAGGLSRTRSLSAKTPFLRSLKAFAERELIGHLISATCGHYPNRQSSQDRDGQNLRPNRSPGGSRPIRPRRSRRRGSDWVPLPSREARISNDNMRWSVNSIDTSFVCCHGMTQGTQVASGVSRRELPCHESWRLTRGHSPR